MRRCALPRLAPWVGVALLAAAGCDKDEPVLRAFQAGNLVEVTGRVVALPDERPLPEVEVTLSSGVLRSPVRTDAAGRFRFDRVPAGRYAQLRLVLAPHLVRSP